MAPSLRFAIPPDFEDSYRMVEINLDRLAEDMQHSARPPVNLDDMHGDSPRKVQNLAFVLQANRGMMHMPALLYTAPANGNPADGRACVYHGYHRMAALRSMGVKVAPVLLSGNTIPESFLERYGVDKPYYRLAEKRGRYQQLTGDGSHDDIVRVFDPIDRDAIMAPPGPYRREAHGAGAEPGDEHVRRLHEGPENTRPKDVPGHGPR